MNMRIKIQEKCQHNAITIKLHQVLLTISVGFEPHRRHCFVVLEQDTFILA